MNRQGMIPRTSAWKKGEKKEEAGQNRARCGAIIVQGGHIQPSRVRDLRMTTRFGTTLSCRGEPTKREKPRKATYAPRNAEKGDRTNTRQPKNPWLETCGGQECFLWSQSWCAHVRFERESTRPTNHPLLNLSPSLFLALSPQEAKGLPLESLTGSLWSPFSFARLFALHELDRLGQLTKTNGSVCRLRFNGGL
jgi:hypothetical protein